MYSPGALIVDSYDGYEPACQKNGARSNQPGKNANGIDPMDSRMNVPTNLPNGENISDIATLLPVDFNYGVWSALTSRLLRDPSLCRLNRCNQKFLVFSSSDVPP